MKDCPKCGIPVDGIRCPRCDVDPYTRRDTSIEVERARAAARGYIAPTRSAIEQEAIDKFPSDGGKPGKWWAHRIVYRHERGERVDALALSSAYEALGVRQTIDEQETR